MTIAIVCDGDNRIGAGHFFRCHAIAKKLLDNSISVHFLIPSDKLSGFIEQSGFQYKIIPDLFSYTNEKIDIILSALSMVHPSAVLIDSQKASFELLAQIKSNYPVAYIDDILQFPYPVDTIINGHMDITVRDYHQLYNTTLTPTLLIGPKYLSLKSMQTPPTDNRSHQNVVSFFSGGSDPDHVTLRMVRYLHEHPMPLNYTLNIIVGLMNDDYAEIKQYAQYIQNIHIHYGLSDLSEIYVNTNLAISAAGITLYELAYYGVPTLTYSSADNQIHTAKFFDMNGICLNLGDSRTDSDFIFERMFKETASVLNDNLQLKIMRDRGMKILDGLGASRIASHLQQMCITHSNNCSLPFV